MITPTRFSLIFWIYILLSANTYGAEPEVPLDKKAEAPYTHHICVMERLEKARAVSSLKNPLIQNKSLQNNPFLHCPDDVTKIILDFVMLYKDQLSFLLCSTQHRKYAKLISTTHIFNLTERKDANSHQLFYINLLEGLEYLWITNCDIPTIRFQPKKLIALAVRWSNINPSLLLDQHSLSYLDVRTINTEYVSPPSLSYLKIHPQSLSRMIFSCENTTLRRTLDNNSGLLVLKLNITKTQEQDDPTNIYEKLPNLRSLEFVDIVSHQDHAHFLTTLSSLSEIILSSFETGQMEASYKEALRIIGAMPQQKHLTLKCLSDAQPWKIVYDGIIDRLDPSQL